MQYNLAEHSIVNSNIDVGNVQLSTVDILSIIQTTSACSPVLSGTDVLCLDCDLGARVEIDEIRYYFSSQEDSIVVASGINFYYKNEGFEIYTSLETLVGDAYYYTTIVSGTSAPRYLRMVHTVSGTSISGTVNGFQVMNDDDVVDFGTGGTDILENFEMVSESIVEEIRPIYIYNDSDIKSDAYVLLEPQGTPVDEMLSISDSQNGPWYKPIQNNNIISGKDIWDTGNYVDTVKVFEQIELVTGSGVGTYTTRIFNTIDTQKFTYLNLNTTYTGTGMMVATNYDDVQETVEIRSSNNKPLDYIIYRKFIPYENDVEGDIPIKYKDYCMYDDSVLFTSSKLCVNLWYSAWKDNWDGDSRGRFYINKTTNKSAALFRYSASDGGNRVVLMRIPSNGVYEKRYLFPEDSFNQNAGIDVYSLLMDVNEGMWFYVYFGTANGWFDQSNSYYLAYFDRDMAEKFKLVDDSAFIYDMDIVNSTGALWYTNQETNRLVQLNKDGDILSEFTFEEDLKGVAAKEDGGCWVVRGSVISNVNSNNEIVSTIDLSSVTNLLTRVAVDGDDALWITDDYIIRRVFLDGRIDFSVELEFQASELQTYDTGVAVFCIDRSWHFISRVDRRVIKTVENSDGKNMYIGVVGVGYDNLIYANEFPIPFDTHWNNVEWNTVSVDNYVLPEDKYNQIKLTLRADESSTSPIVNSLYLNESIQIQNIYPENYKTMYMKADISNYNESDSNSYESNLKVWWYLPV